MLVSDGSRRARLSAVRERERASESERSSERERDFIMTPVETPGSLHSRGVGTNKTRQKCPRPNVEASTKTANL